MKVISDSVEPLLFRMGLSTYGLAAPIADCIAVAQEITAERCQ